MAGLEKPAEKSHETQDRWHDGGLIDDTKEHLGVGAFSKIPIEWEPGPGSQPLTQMWKSRPIS